MQGHERSALGELRRTFLSVWMWIEIVLVTIATFCCTLVATLLFGAVDRLRRAPAHVVRLGSVLVVKLNPLWKFEVVGDVPKRPTRVVCVSNHASHTDPFLISHVPWDTRWLAKRSLFLIPVLGWAMWLRGDIGVKRGDAESARKAMLRCRSLVERGVPIVIFPEGTRSRDGGLLPFKDGAFRLAIEAGATILPMAVSGTAAAWPKHDWRAGRARGRLRIGAPISTAGMDLADVPRLKERAKSAIEALLGELRGEAAHPAAD